MASSAAARASGEPLVLDGARSVVVGALAVGAALGFGGNLFEQGNTQNVMYALSALGLILGSVLLAVQHVSAGRLLAAAGFVMLALGETRVLNPTDAPGGEASFAAGVLLYAPALLMIALSRWAPLWVRLLGAIAAVPFAAHGLVYLGGGDVESTGALAGIGYALFTVTIIGWILTVLRSERDRTS
ncbi:MAG TPA: hypothetical protein VGR11_11305 [Solirubrobacteraceae bacterium]|nr:hypothetical protein [Solirubrobacteraceae bacterium]